MSLDDLLDDLLSYSRERLHDRMHDALPAGGHQKTPEALSWTEDFGQGTCLESFPEWKMSECL